jgi:hypothetical protein
MPKKTRELSTYDAPARSAAVLSPVPEGLGSYKTISEPGRAAHKMLVPVETVMFDILLAEPLSYSATNAQICSALI